MKIASFVKRYNYRHLIASLIILCLTMSTIGYLQYTRQQQRLEASHHYEMLLAYLSNQPSSTHIRSQATTIAKSYPNTPYAPLALLQLARQAVYHNQLSDAENWLMQVISSSPCPHLQAIARTRAARILLATNRPEQALNLLDDTACIGYTAACAEIKGDIFLALGNKQSAFQAYQEAKQAIADLGALRPLIQMKLEALTKP